MIWILLVILLIILIVSISKGNKKKNLEIKKLQTEVSQPKQSEPIKSSDSIADELAKLKDLKDKGVLTDAEFEQQKSKILNR